MSDVPRKRKRTHYEKQVGRLIAEVVKRRSRVWIVATMRSASAVPPDEFDLQGVLPELAGMTSPTNMQLLRSRAAGVVRKALRSFVMRFAGEKGFVSEALLVDVLRTLQSQALLTDMKFRLPPKAKEPRPAGTKAPPLTLVQRRARLVHDSLSRWERRLKLAKTKVAVLKKRQSYYRRKGVV